MLRHLKVQKAHPLAYILENVPLLGDTQIQLMASVHEVQLWIGLVVLLDVATVGSRAHGSCL